VVLHRLSDRKFVGRLTSDTPLDSKSGPGRPRELPDDLLRQASHRLEILSLIGAALWVLGPLLGHVSLYVNHPEDPRWYGFHTVDQVAVGALVASLALYAYLRSGHREPRLVMDIGLCYMVAVSFAIGVLIHWGPPSGEPPPPLPTITWVGPVILMFAALIPASPRKLFLAGLVAASMDPLGMVLARATGAYHFGALHNIFLMHYPNYLMLGVGVVISQVVTRLGQQVTRDRELGSYRLGELLGSGGMGEVYRATHRMLARPAAIKLIRPEVLAAGDGGSVQLAIARFRREADAAANLRSPHTVELYDFGVTGDQRLYFVMELLEGMDLDTLVRTHGPLPPARAIHILRQVCDSLEEAHSAGLVHRDIKPANIHVGRLGLRNDWVKVLDFGLVKSVDDGNSQRSLATAQGLTPGTPAYMAPEMALEERVDGRADLYALGCVAYYLLTGRLVFEAASQFQLVAKHLNERPVAPSERMGEPLDPTLERLVLDCLAKAPSERPASAAELDRRLAAVPIAPWSEADAKAWWEGIKEMS
jgi:serine/threonine-protein kinase